MNATVTMKPMPMAHEATAIGPCNGNRRGYTLSACTLAAPVSLAGPHGTMKVKDESGKVWDITLAPGARVERAGLKEGVIPVGAPVTIEGHRSRDPNKFEVKTERVMWNGKTFNVYPDRK